MSFGFGVGDFLAAGERCLKLHHAVCEVSQDAPVELRGIRDELRALLNTIWLLNNDIQDYGPDQERNLNVVVDIMRKVNDTLLEVQSLAEKHGLLHVPEKGGASRQSLKVQWGSFMLSKEWSTVNELRAKV